MAEGGFGAEAVDVVIHPATVVHVGGIEHFAKGIVSIAGTDSSATIGEGDDVAVAIVEGVAGAGISCRWDSGDGE